jgi:hypothetical protein
MTLLIHAACCLMMTGLCLFVAVVHYPLMARVARGSAAGGPEGWTDYERAHASRTSLVVAPLMLLEVVSAGWITLGLKGDLPPSLHGLWWANIAGLAACWAITFLVNVPQHNRLARGWDGPTHRRLVLTHWLRTLVWLARCVVLLALLARL